MSRANVYIIAEQDGPRKIGMSDDPAGRMLTLRAGRAPLSVRHLVQIHRFVPQ
jgi:hypothetical protein